MLKTASYLEEFIETGKIMFGRKTAIPVSDTFPYERRIKLTVPQNEIAAILTPLTEIPQQAKEIMVNPDGCRDGA